MPISTSPLSAEANISPSSAPPARRTRDLVFSIIFFGWTGVSIWMLTQPDLAPFGAPWRNHFSSLAALCLGLFVVFAKIMTFKAQSARAHQLPVPRGVHLYAMLAIAAMGGLEAFTYWKEPRVMDPWMVILTALVMFVLAFTYLRIWMRAVPKSRTISPS